MTSTFSANQIVEHHPHISNRFIVKPEFYDPVVQEIIEEIKNVTGYLLEIVSYEFDLNGEVGIVSVWLDSDRNVDNFAQKQIRDILSKRFLENTLWWESEKDCTRVSIWKVLLPSLFSELRELESNWKDQVR